MRGCLLHKIVKDHRKVRVPESYKKERLTSVSEKQRPTLYFPEYFPPFRGFFTDDEGRLYVMTYENGPDGKSRVFDVFDPNGLFLFRKSLDVVCQSIGVMARMQKNTLVYLGEKENGFKVLKISRVVWKEDRP
jgi:hypothetical protein